MLKIFTKNGGSSGNRTNIKSLPHFPLGKILFEESWYLIFYTMNNNALSFFVKLDFEERGSPGIDPELEGGISVKFFRHHFAIFFHFNASKFLMENFHKKSLKKTDGNLTTEQTFVP